ncbi:MAG TPA: hypothetical protein VEM13_06360 [Gemmatimonadales bacterium]|nr:hypothetical protein [Gemmatimonadales bacterium]
MAGRSEGKFLTTAILLGIAYVAVTVSVRWAFGGDAAFVVGLGLAATAVLLVEKRDKLSRRADNIVLYPIPAPWSLAAAIGILTVYSADALIVLGRPLLRLLDATTSATMFVISLALWGVAISAGFFLSGLTIGSLVPNKATFASTLGVVVYFTLKIPSIFSTTDSAVLRLIPDATATELRTGALTALVLRLGLTLYGSRLAIRRWSSPRESA